MLTERQGERLPDWLDAVQQAARPLPCSSAHWPVGAGEARLPDGVSSRWGCCSPQDDLPSLHTLAVGIDRDLAALVAGLTLPWNSGAVEGHVNRIKMLKRQMFGRAGFALLRKRVLLAQ
ncbi:hypothetical protein ACIHJG_40325 [Streptomyces sp. NPDC052415]|uniref:hypothetical protein n=1 Tax=Streptomyces sp. NPDC052415 TaxID=3365690 RepID=UPI0037D0053C